MAYKRKAYLGKKGFVRGTIVKPKYFDEKLVVDKDFGTKAIQDETGELSGRDIFPTSDRTAIIRNSSGEVVGRTKALKRPYPKSYPIRSGKKVRRIPVIDWD